MDDVKWEKKYAADVKDMNNNDTEKGIFSSFIILDLCYKTNLCSLWMNSYWIRQTV